MTGARERPHAVRSMIDGESSRDKIVKFSSASSFSSEDTIRCSFHVLKTHIDRPLFIQHIIHPAEEEDVVIEEDAHMDTALGNVDIGFESFKMTLQQKKGKPERAILDGSIRGEAKAGRLLAVMGPSGSGKSTFLHALAGRIKESSKVSLSGKRYFNGEEVAGDSQLPAAFIEQEVNFFPHMTVYETLSFRVDLKLGKKLSKSEREEVVSTLMEQLSLTKSKNTIVGNSKIRGLSGGERKRLSIACEVSTGVSHQRNTNSSL